MAKIPPITAASACKRVEAAGGRLVCADMDSTNSALHSTLNTTNAARCAGNITRGGYTFVGVYTISLYKPH